MFIWLISGLVFYPITPADAANVVFFLHPHPLRIGVLFIYLFIVSTIPE